jgi:hypothetical protein
VFIKIAVYDTEVAFEDIPGEVYFLEVGFFILVSFTRAFAISKMVLQANLKFSLIDVLLTE